MKKINLTKVEVLSYDKNNYGKFFYEFVIKMKPKVILEMGSYMGYSGLHFASGLRDNKIKSQLILVDLWSNYLYRKCSKKDIINSFKINNFDKDKNLTIFNCL